MAQIVKRVPDAFAGAEVPPAMPANVSPIQQQAAAVEAPALTPAEELDRLFPATAEIVVQALKGNPEPGVRKVRESLTVYLEEATIEEWAGIARPLRTLADLTDGKKDVDITSLIELHRKEVIEALAAATNLSQDVLKHLRVGDVLALVEGVVMVNRGFFVLRLPQAFAMVTQLQRAVLGDGATSLPISQETDSQTPAA